MLVITQLPFEVLLLITAFSERDELKALRVTNSVLLKVANEHLFQEIHISPNSHSFDRAHNVAADNSLRVHVKCLVYHFGMLDDVYPGFDSFRNEHSSTRRVGVVHDPSKVTAELLWCYNCFLEEMDSQRTFECMVEEEELRMLCERLPNLVSISTLLDEVTPFEEPQDYIGRRTGVAALVDYGNGRFSNLLKAVMDRRLHKISARSIQWHDLEFLATCDIQLRALCLDLLCKLQYLELGFYAVLEYCDPDEETTFQASLISLSLVLDNACNLTTLKLDFEELPYESQSVRLLPISETIFSHCWPFLRELKLEAICTEAPSLLDFLTSHSQSLRLLCIGDIELVGVDGVVPSVLRLFQDIRKSLRLTSCKITGNFTNRVDEAWYVDTECKIKNCLRDQLEVYLSNHSEEDLDDPPEVSDAQMEIFWRTGEQIRLWLHMVVDGYDNFQDESWQWCPELLEES